MARCAIARKRRKHVDPGAEKSLFGSPTLCEAQISTFAVALSRVRLRASAAGALVHSTRRNPSLNRYVSAVLENGRPTQNYARRSPR
jgi:hypothetical protein